MLGSDLYVAVGNGLLNFQNGSYGNGVIKLSLPDMVVCALKWHVALHTALSSCHSQSRSLRPQQVFGLERRCHKPQRRLGFIMRDLVEDMSATTCMVTTTASACILGYMRPIKSRKNCA